MTFRPALHRSVGRALVTGALVVAATAACSSGPEEASSSSSSAGGAGGTLRVGELGSAQVTEALLAASGEDEGLPYEIEWSLFPAGPAFIEAVPSGSVDLALMADTPPIFGQVAGIETKVVGVQTSLREGESFVEIFAPADSGLTSVEDLRGKKVAILEGTILQYTVVKALEEAGLEYSDITPVNLPPADALTAYQNGDVDAVAALGPQLGQLHLASNRVIGDGAGVTTGYQYAVAASASLENEQTVANITDYLQRVGRAQDWADEHRDEWTQQYAEVLGVPVELAKLLVDRQDYSWVPIDDSVVAAQQEQADTYTDLGLIDGKLDVAVEFDDRLNGDLTEGTDG